MFVYKRFQSIFLRKIKVLNRCFYTSSILFDEKKDRKGIISNNKDEMPLCCGSGCNECVLI